MNQTSSKIKTTIIKNLEQRGLLSLQDYFSMSDDDVLIVKNMINAQYQKFLSMHSNAIYQGTGKDTRFKTYVPDKSASRGRRLICKNTKKEVEDELVLFYMKLTNARRQPQVSQTINVSEFFKVWIDYKSSTNISDQTIRRYRNDYKRHIENSEFGKMLIIQIDFIDIECFLTEEIERLNLKKKALNNLFGYLKQMMWYARRLRLVTSNPCEDVDIREIRRQCDTSTKSNEESILSKEELQSLLKTLHYQQANHPLYMPNYAIEICIYTGLRVGEVCSLRWDCIKGCNLSITQSEHRIEKSDGSDDYVIGDTKNKKKRLVPITQDLHRLLMKIKKLQHDNGISSEFIIADANGRVIGPNISKAMYRRGIEANIKAKSIHAIRKTVSSQLNTCLPRASVALILGHTEEVNMEHYDYDTTSFDDKLNAMESIF